MTYNNADRIQRVFIGIPIEERMQKAIEELLQPLQARQHKLRWVAPANRHMTLAFLGDIQADDVGNLLEVFAESYRLCKSFHFRFSALNRFPNRRGRIVALTGETSPPLDSLVMSTRDMLQGCGLRFERKQFRPHITLARVRNPKPQMAGLGRLVQIDMDISRVVVYRSTLMSAGSIYSMLGEAVLPGVQ